VKRASGLERRLGQGNEWQGNTGLSEPTADYKCGSLLCLPNVLPTLKSADACPFHEPLLGARTALSARTSAPELADKAVRAPGFTAAMHDFTIGATLHEPCSSGRESAPFESEGKFEPTHVGCYSAGVQGVNPGSGLFSPAVHGGSVSQLESSWSATVCEAPVAALGLVPLCGTQPRSDRIRILSVVGPT
jgi:hypothetical protein